IATTWPPTGPSTDGPSGCPHSSKKSPSVKARCLGASTWMMPSDACVCSQYRQVPPCAAEFTTREPGIPTPAGTCRCAPLTKMTRCEWMWRASCSDVWQRIPSTARPVAAELVPASGVPSGIGTPSKPFAPGLGAGRRLPSVLSGPSLSTGWLPVVPDFPPFTANTIATAATIARTAAPIPVKSLRCRACRASLARISATFALAISRFLLGLDTCLFPPCQDRPLPSRPSATRAYWTVGPRNSAAPSSIRDQQASSASRRPSRRALLRGAAGVGAASAAMTALAGLGRSALAAREKTDGRADRGADAQDKSARHADGGAGAQAAAEHTEHAEQLVIHVKDAKTSRID